MASITSTGWFLRMLWPLAASTAVTRPAIGARQNVSSANFTGGRERVTLFGISTSPDFVLRPPF
jgi:hypothetical protein